MSVSTHGSQQGSTTLSKDIEMLDPLSSPDAFLNRASINQTILGKIVAAKQEWVAARKLAQPLESFKNELTQSDQAIHILIADDNPLNRQIASLQLRRHLPRAKVTEVGTGLQAFEHVRDGSVDVILMDLLMPEMDGLEASRKIRTELPEPQCSTPIIALTANTDRDELARCIEYGMNECMLKPFNRAHLVQRVLSYVA